MTEKRFKIVNDCGDYHLMNGDVILCYDLCSPAMREENWNNVVNKLNEQEEEISTLRLIMGVNGKAYRKSVKEYEEFIEELEKENEELKKEYNKLKHRHSLLHDVCIEAECDRDSYHKDVVSLEKENEQLKLQLDYLQSSITEAINHSKTELEQKSLKKVIENYNEYMLGHKEVSE